MSSVNSPNNIQLIINRTEEYFCKLNSKPNKQFYINKILNELEILTSCGNATTESQAKEFCREIKHKNESGISNKLIDYIAWTILQLKGSESKLKAENHFVKSEEFKKKLEEIKKYHNTPFLKLMAMDLLKDVVKNDRKNLIIAMRQLIEEKVITVEEIAECWAEDLLNQDKTGTIFPGKSGKEVLRFLVYYCSDSEELEKILKKNVSGYADRFFMSEGPFKRADREKAIEDAKKIKGDAQKMLEKKMELKKYLPEGMDDFPKELNAIIGGYLPREDDLSRITLLEECLQIEAAEQARKEIEAEQARKAMRH